MADHDYAELIAWRLAFDHLGDGTPDGAACAINEQIAELQAQRDAWKKVAADSLRIAAAGSVYEIVSNNDVRNW